jgi:excisionase family DNA binding protein
MANKIENGAHTGHSRVKGNEGSRISAGLGGGGLQNRLALSIAEFATVTGVSRSKLYEEIKAGRLKIAKVGRRTLVSGEAGLAWLRAREVK